MRLLSEDQILDQVTRKRIITELKGSENVNRKAEYLKRYEIYKDNTKRHVIDGLMAEGLKPTTIAQMSNRAGNISICRKIVNKKARAYSGGVQRTGEDDLTTSQLSELARLLSFDAVMKKGDRYRELYKNCLFQVVPELDLDESDSTFGNKWELKFNVLAPWQYDVIEDPYNREEPMVVLVSDFTDRPVRNGTDGKDNIIADSPEDSGKDETAHYVWWSKSFHFTTDDEGAIILNKSPEDLANPIAMLPFVNNAEEQDGQYWAQGGDDLIQGSILVNKLITDMNFIAYLQGFGQLVVTGKNIQEKNFAWGPNNACIIEHGEEDPVPNVQILSANPPLDSWMKLVQQYIALLLTTNNLSPGAVSVDLSASNFPSGIAMLIEQSESTESVSDKQKAYIEIEREIWEVVQAWHNVYLEAGALCDDFAELGSLPEEMDVSIKFHEARPPISEAEKLANIKTRSEIGINEKVDLILLDNPDLTREEAEEKLARIAEEKMKSVTSMASAMIKDSTADSEDDNSEDTQDDGNAAKGDNRNPEDNQA